MAQIKLTTSRGREIEIQPVSDTLIGMALANIEKEWRARGEPLDAPTYTVPIAGGADFETYPHDERSAAQTSPEVLAQFRAYEDANARLDAEKEQRRLKILLHGLKFEILDDGWEGMQKLLGVEIPTDPEERWFHYLTTEVLVTPDDLLRAIELVTKASYAGAVDEDAISAAMDNFRGQLRENSAKAFANRTGAVVAQPETK